MDTDQLVRIGTVVGAVLVALATLIKALKKGRRKKLFYEPERRPSPGKNAPITLSQSKNAPSKSKNSRIPFWLALIAFIGLIIFLMIFEASRYNPTTPSGAVDLFFSNIKKSHFEDAWNAMTDNYRRQRFPRGIEDLKDTYQPYALIVTPPSIQIKAIDPSTAVAYFTLGLTTKDGTTIQKPTVFYLYKPPDSLIWLISGEK